MPQCERLLGARGSIKPAHPCGDGCYSCLLRSMEGFLPAGARAVYLVVAPQRGVWRWVPEPCHHHGVRVGGYLYHLTGVGVLVPSAGRYERRVLAAGALQIAASRLVGYTTFSDDELHALGQQVKDGVSSHHSLACNCQDFSNAFLANCCYKGYDGETAFTPARSAAVLAVTCSILTILFPKLLTFAVDRLCEAAAEVNASISRHGFTASGTLANFIVFAFVVWMVRAMFCGRQRG